MDNENIDVQTYEYVISHFDCFQKCLFYMFEKDLIITCFPVLASWSFFYNNRSRVVGEGIQHSIVIYVNSILQRYLNIPVRFHENGFSGDICLINDAVKKGRRVMVGFDAFYCPWNISYLKAHVVHFAVIEQMDAKSEGIIFMDPFVSSETQKISLENFRRMYKNCRIFEVQKNYSLAKIPWMAIFEILCSNYKRLTGKSTVKDEFYKFADAIDGISDISQLVEYDDIRLCSITRELKMYAGTRMSIGCFLEIYEKEGNYMPISSLYKHFYEMAYRMQKINMSLLKVQIQGKLDRKTLHNVSDQVRNLGNLEEDMFQHIQNKIMLSHINLPGEK